MKRVYAIILATFFYPFVYSRDLFYLPEKNRTGLEDFKGKLIGIVSSGQKKICLVSDNDSGVASYAEKGMTWCGYEIVEIRKHSLVLQKGKEKRVLFLN